MLRTHPGECLPLCLQLGGPLRALPTLIALMLAGYLIGIAAVHHVLRAHLQCLDHHHHVILFSSAVLASLAGHVHALPLDTHSLTLFGAQVRDLTHCLLDL